MDTNYFLYCPGEIIQKRGGATAMIFGVVYYLSKRDDGYCWASQETIGKYAKLTDRSVRTHLRKLQEDGYIEVYEKDGQASGYRPTHVWQTRVSFEKTPEKISALETGTPEKISEATEREPRKKFPTKRSKDNKNLTSSQMWVEILGKATGLDTRMKTNVGRLARAGKDLRAGEYTIDDVERIYLSEAGAWWSHDFRGKKGQKPTPEQILTTISNLSDIKQQTYRQQLEDANYV